MPRTQHEDARAERRRTPRRVTRAFGWISLGLVLAICVIVGLYGWQVTSAYQQAEKIPTSEAFPDPDTRPAPISGQPGEDNDPVNILVLGSDNEDPAQQVGLDSRGTRSDTIMVVNIPADRDSVNAMSIMRDNWVPIPGHGTQKINAATSYGGTPLAVQTVEDLLDTRIDHVVLIDFDGFRGLTDAVGGVQIDNPSAFYSDGTLIPAGEVTLNGDQALSFVRNRDFPDGDYTRVSNQQRFIESLLDELISGETLKSPRKMRDAMESFSPHVQFNEELNFSSVVSLGLSLRGLNKRDITLFTSPTLGIDTEGEQSIVRPDWDGLEEISQHLRADSLADYLSNP